MFSISQIILQLDTLGVGVEALRKLQNHQVLEASSCMESTGIQTEMNII